jgi:hypothetical protein
MSAFEQEDDKQIVDFFKIVSKGIRKYGIKNIVSKLKKIDLDGMDDNFVKIKLSIVQSVCKYFEIEEKKLVGFKHRGKVTVARNIAIVLFKVHLDMSNSDIGIYFGGRCRQVAYNVVRDFGLLSRDNSIDISNYFKHYDVINEKVEKQIEKLENQGRTNSRKK